MGAEPIKEDVYEFLRDIKPEPQSKQAKKSTDALLCVMQEML
jgi:hypothetical protein